MSSETGEKIYLEEGVVKVTSSRVVLGEKNFVLRNISAVEVWSDGRGELAKKQSILIAVGGFIFLILSLISVTGLSKGTAHPSIFLVPLFFFIFAYFCSKTKNSYFVQISTSGTTNNTVKSSTRDFPEKAVKAINDALLDLDNSEKNNTPTSTQSSDSGSELKKFKQMLDDGLISQEDYDAKKKQILGL